MTKAHDHIIWLDNARCLATIGVVLLHVSAMVVFSDLSLTTVSWWTGGIALSVTRCSVPIFLIISGYLNLEQPEHEAFSNLIRRRLIHITPPLLFWTFFYYGLAIWLGLRLGYHIWFMYLIFTLYILSPGLSYLTKFLNPKQFLFMLLGLFIIANVGLSYIHWRGTEIPALFYLPMFLPYYLFGLLLRRKAFFDVIASARWTCCHSPKALWFTTCLSIAFTAIVTYFEVKASSVSDAIYFLEYLSPNIIVISLCVILILRKTNKPCLPFQAAISHRSLGIYLVHPVILHFVNILMLPISYNFGAVAIPVTFLLVLLLSMGVVSIIHRVPPLRWFI